LDDALSEIVGTQESRDGLACYCVYAMPHLDDLALRHGEAGSCDYGASLTLVHTRRKEQFQWEVGKIVLHSSQFGSLAVSLCILYDVFPCPLGHSNTLVLDVPKPSYNFPASGITTSPIEPAIL